MLSEAAMLDSGGVVLLLLASWTVVCVDPESGGTVQRLMSQQENLIQSGLSYINR